MQLKVAKESDALYFRLNEKAIVDSEEMRPGVILDYGKDGQVVEQEGWAVDRFKPLLLGLAELIPWLKQWHNGIDPVYNERMGDFFDVFLQGQLQQVGLTRNDLNNWEPPSTGRRRGQRRQ